MLDINQFVVLKDCMCYEGMHKYYIFQFDSAYTLLADTNRAILYRAESFADMISYIERMETCRKEDIPFFDRAEKAHFEEVERSDK